MDYETKRLRLLSGALKENSKRVSDTMTSVRSYSYKSYGSYFNRNKADDGVEHETLSIDGITTLNSELSKYCSVLWMACSGPKWCTFSIDFKKLFPRASKKTEQAS